MAVKQLKYWIIPVLLLLAAVIGTQVIQASSITLRVPIMEAKQGGTVDLPVQATGAPGVGALQMDLVYDGAVLKPDTVTKGLLLGSNALLQSNTDTTGRVMIALATLDGIKGDGDIVTVRFKVIGQAGQTSSLKLENALAWEGASHQDILIKTEAGQIKVTGGSSFPIWIIIIVIAVILLLVLIIFLSRRSKKKKPAAT